MLLKDWMPMFWWTPESISNSLKISSVNFTSDECVLKRAGACSSPWWTPVSISNSLKISSVNFTVEEVFFE